MNSTYELDARYDSRKSFYGKARVTQMGDKAVLTSYSTDVAEIDGDTVTVHGTYSATTLRHIKEFLRQAGFRADTKGQIIEDYMS